MLSGPSTRLDVCSHRKRSSIDPVGRETLSKSRLISAWQCPKKLHLEKHHPELAEITDNMESLFAMGHQVGAIAQDLYGTAESVEIPFNRKMSRMVQETQALIDGGADFPNRSSV